MPPSSAEALVVKTNGSAASTLERRSIPIPSPGEHQVLVRISYVAQNPTDVQSLDTKAFDDGAVLGCDFVGTVEQLGPGVSRFSKGDTIAGLIWGGETPGQGGYSQYALADPRIAFPVPDTIRPEEAATVPLAALTAVLALFSEDSLAIDKGTEVRESVLIWGGSSSVGLFAIQIAAMYGLDVVTTCSPAHHDLVRSLGASHVFDYHDEQVVDKIRSAAPELRYVFDSIGNETSSATASKAIAQGGGTLCTVRPGKDFTKDVADGVKVTDVLVWTAFLKEHKYRDTVYPISKADHTLAVDFFAKLPQLLTDGTIKPNRVKVFDGGLSDVEKGFQEYRDGKISNYKIVYKL
ncbi:chaperonin 10-like protein [Plectosphaerella cucumerina]|uniref:Chaperonin 10-like protein n=1 Tax=Plectosphaerella cucumerina TaxID=40658 RepID=A0A8K0THJ5_9PEZI|nr:chaperonin 10-like protein [Plectosphaerella cucumerina]